MFLPFWVITSWYQAVKSAGIGVRPGLGSRDWGQVLQTNISAIVSYSHALATDGQL